MNGSRINPGDRLGLTLFLALVLHAMVILGISFKFEPPKRQPPPDRTLEIMVVRNPQPEKKPEKADFLAQASQQGGGEAEKKVRPKTVVTPPAPVQAPQPAPRLQPTPPPQEAQQAPPKKVIAQKRKPSRKVQVVPRRKPKQEKRKRRVNIAELLASSNREIERLTAELDRKRDNYAKRPRRKVVSAATQEYKYASYLDAWRKKVERIGNLNYPDEAKRRKLYGDLILHVAIRPDGTVKEINVKKSSGYKLLDDAAIRIVHLAAPFAPFPAEIREETDIIDIIRTWQFRNNNQLSSR
ncbi:MAG TPA: energy transducer TonB [Sedimenticola thiotaurini]|uniref:Energy transducer TonB n=1 Tax=Sedimenticola thiotaurini TaxID=1543721 RepID=A0A831RPV6_9GAMM|nr:energy transducer TonB [Sedimenticola thiotaurini]